MNKPLAVGLMAFSALALCGADQAKWTGSLTDASCKAADVAAKCDASESTKAFGITTDDGKFVKFDEAGNSKAMLALESRRGRPGEKKVTITGTMDGDTVKVEAIEVH